MAIATDWIKGKQEIFNWVVDHLLTQNEKCVDTIAERCSYRGTSIEGHLFACAAGCLIPDKYYNPKLEGNGWKRIFDPTWNHDKAIRNFAAYTTFSEEEHELINNLQQLHDGFPSSAWRDQLIYTAGKYNLRYLVVLTYDKKIEA